MSSEKGNSSRTRPQAHQNTRAFKNDMHNKTPQLKLINSIEISGVCSKCKNILEWKIKYKKYKLLKNPKICVKCLRKTVKKPYHIMCDQCATLNHVCPKCDKGAQLVEKVICVSERLLRNPEFKTEINKLPLRRKSTLLRYIDRVAKKQPGGCVQSEDEMRKIEEEVIKKLQSMKVEKDDCSLSSTDDDGEGGDCAEEGNDS